MNYTWNKLFSCRGVIVLFFVLTFSTACAVAVRQAFKVDQSLPIGNIQGDSFLGQRYPFKVKIPPGWQASTKYPDFLLQQGYDKEGLQATPVFLFNDRTKSSVQIDFSPAGRTVQFDQKLIEDLTRMGGGSFLSELREEHGKNIQVELSRVEPLQLKGVPYAARMSAKYAVKGESREQGWVYGFAEPFQIFILYLLTGQDLNPDKEALEQILPSFEYIGYQ